MTVAGAPAPQRPALTAYRLFWALLIFAAIVTEIATLVERGTLVLGNLLSYFTIQANSFAVLVLLLSVVSARDNRTVNMMRGASTLYMAVTGVVFSVLLSGIEGVDFTAVAWDNTVLHFLGPIAVVLDWFLDLPRSRIQFKSALMWLVYPLVYGAYSLIRGPIVDWYPYPFLDPGKNGYLTIAGTLVVLTVFGAALTWLIVRFTGRTPAKASD